METNVFVVLPRRRYPPSGTGRRVTRSRTPDRAVTVPRGVSRRTATPVTPVSRTASASRRSDRAAPVRPGAAVAGKAEPATATEVVAITMERRVIMHPRLGGRHATAHPAHATLELVPAAWTPPDQASSNGMSQSAGVPPTAYESSASATPAAPSR